MRAPSTEHLNCFSNCKSRHWLWGPFSNGFGVNNWLIFGRNDEATCTFDACIVYEASDGWWQMQCSICNQAIFQMRQRTTKNCLFVRFSAENCEVCCANTFFSSRLRKIQSFAIRVRRINCRLQRHATAMQVEFGCERERPELGVIEYVQRRSFWLFHINNDDCRMTFILLFSLLLRRTRPSPNREESDTVRSHKRQFWPFSKHKHCRRMCQIDKCLPFICNKFPTFSSSHSFRSCIFW